MVVAQILKNLLSFLKQISYGKCSKITNTKKYLFFSAVRNFRNYVYGKNASVRNFRMWTLSGEKR